MRSVIILLFTILPIFSSGQDSGNIFRFGSCKGWKEMDLKGGPMETIDSTGYIIVKAVFSVSVTNENKVTKIELIESSNLMQDSTIMECKKMIENHTWDFGSSSSNPPLMVGKFTFCIAEKKKDD